MVELISYYTQNSLKECFQGLDMKLKYQFRDLSLVRASYDFTPGEFDLLMNCSYLLREGLKKWFLSLRGEGGSAGFNYHFLFFCPNVLKIISRH